jgi:uncharacterized protein (TIGR02466 family)
LIKNLFTVGVAKFNIGNIDNQSLIDYCKPFQGQQDKSIEFDTGDKVLDNIKYVFTETGEEFLKELLGSKEKTPVKIKKMWGNYNVENSIIQPHTHKTSLISAVYYCTHGQITFQNPFHVQLAHIDQKNIVEWNEYNSDHRFLNLVPGDLIVFNSQIYHYASITNDLRVSIACDMVVENE